MILNQMFALVTTLVFRVRDDRIEEAKWLLRESDLQPSEIAFDVGFDSMGLFARAFGARVGQSPIEFRSRRREIEGWLKRVEKDAGRLADTLSSLQAAASEEGETQINRIFRNRTRTRVAQ